MLLLANLPAPKQLLNWDLEQPGTSRSARQGSKRHKSRPKATIMASTEASVLSLFFWTSTLTPDASKDLKGGGGHPGLAVGSGQWARATTPAMHTLFLRRSVHSGDREFLEGLDELLHHNPSSKRSGHSRMGK